MRERWLTIEMEPLVGERAFSVAPIGAHELGHTRAAVPDRLDRLCAALVLDRSEPRGYALAHTLAWAFEGDRVLPRHVQTARWLHAS